MRIAGFDWDDGNREKCQKHGVSCAEIEDMFSRAPAILPDPAHSRDEQRWRAIGQTVQGRYIFIVFTLRPADAEVPFLRPISARHMHEEEIQHYERQQGRS
ncbi:BrnT family toxin [Aquisalimonas sp.]|uniref:BrnT family toxin n=1 Tax=Aquisalimonas sp. TaxID=1872621 RepID=UPI0025B914E4|nr:BrnT family toxin [Aquisalimonas sp.]